MNSVQTTHGGQYVRNRKFFRVRHTNSQQHTAQSVKSISISSTNATKHRYKTKTYNKKTTKINGNLKVRERGEML